MTAPLIRLVRFWCGTAVQLPFQPQLHCDGWIGWFQPQCNCGWGMDIEFCTRNKLELDENIDSVR